MTNFILVFTLFFIPMTTLASGSDISSVKVDGDNKYIMGDLLVDEESMGEANLYGTRPVKVQIWQDGVLPIVFTKGVTEDVKNLIWTACKEWSSVAKVKCISGPYKKRKLTISPKFLGLDTGCWSMLGMGSYFMGLKRRMNIGKGCAWYSTVLHELGHALGLGHEHQRPDRDKYIQIHKENIEPSFLGLNTCVNFGNQNGETLTSYDFLSIMHYSSTSFSKNGKPTMLPRPGYETYANTMGRVSHLSASDILAIQKLYGKP